MRTLTATELELVSGGGNSEERTIWDWFKDLFGFGDNNNDDKPIELYFHGDFEADMPVGPDEKVRVDVDVNVDVEAGPVTGGLYLETPFGDIKIFDFVVGGS